MAEPGLELGIRFSSLCASDSEPVEAALVEHLPFQLYALGAHVHLGH